MVGSFMRASFTQLKSGVNEMGIGYPVRLTLEGRPAPFSLFLSR